MHVGRRWVSASASELASIPFLAPSKPRCVPHPTIQVYHLLSYTWSLAQTVHSRMTDWTSKACSGVSGVADTGRMNSTCGRLLVFLFVNVRKEEGLSRGLQYGGRRGLGGMIGIGETRGR